MFVFRSQSFVTLHFLVANLHCLRLFYKDYINVYCYDCGVFIKKHVYIIIPSFVLIGYCVHGIVMYGLRLFIVDLHCLLNCLHVCIIRVRGWYHITKFCYSTLSGF